VFDAETVIAVGLLNVGVAGAVAYVVYRLIVPKRESRQPIDTARRSTAYICVVVILTLLPKLFHARSMSETVNAYAALVINLVIWGVLVFVVGWLIGRLFLKYEKPTKE